MIKYFLIHGTMNIRFHLKIFFWPNFKQKDDVNSDWVNLLLKIRAMDSFDFPECFIVCGSVNFNSLWYFTQFVSESWWIPVKLEKKPVAEFFSSIVFLWVCVYPSYIYLSPAVQYVTCSRLIGGQLHFTFWGVAGQ